MSNRIIIRLRNKYRFNTQIKEDVCMITVAELLEQMPYVKYLYIYDNNGKLRIVHVNDGIEEYLQFLVYRWNYSSGNLAISLY